jgi:hypothetical protein
MAHGAKTIRQDEFQLPPGSRWHRLPVVAGLLGLIAVAASFALRGGDPARFSHSWLVAFLFFLSISLGAIFFVLVHFAAKAAWGVVVRRLAENLGATVPLFLLLFVPILLGLGELYHWADAEHVAHDKVLQGKAGWLNPGFFAVRAAIELGAWSLLAWWFLRVSRRQDDSGSEALTRRMIAVAGPGLIVFALTVTFASFDWIMSLDPHWYSTMFGVYYFSGCLVGAFATLILLSLALTRSGILRQVITVEHFHDLGKLLYAFTVFWAYIGFCQFFLIWYANLPEETTWYLRRTDGGWYAFTVALAVGHFALPFLFLMSQHIKRRRGFLAASAVWMLVMHLLDVYWLVMPGYLESGPDLHPLDLTTLVGVGGLVLATFGALLRRSDLVPSRDPRLLESLGFENV